MAKVKLPPMYGVESSAIKSVGYSRDGWETMYIMFKNGGLYAYYNVPKKYYIGMKRSPSAGKYFWKRIKYNYPWKRVSYELKKAGGKGR